MTDSKLKKFEKSILKCENLCKSFGRKEILHDVNLEIPQGRLVGFLGPNGSGKTTTFKCILNLIHYQGKIEVAGKDAKRNPEHAQRCIGSTIEGPAFYAGMSGYENLKLLSMYYKDIKKSEIDKLVEMLSMQDYIGKKVEKYSLGMKQRVAIAMALLHSPELLLLDEPMNGLDPEGIRDLRNILKSICHDEGRTIFVSSHILSEMQLLCDEVIFIKEGHIIGHEEVNDQLEERYLSKMHGKEVDLKIAV